MNMPVTPTTDPTDKSMLRLTMTSTMPVAMIETAAVWTDRFHRLRGDRNWPLVPMSKTIQLMISAAIMPISRVSISADRISEAYERPDGAVVDGATEGAAPG